MTRLSQTLCIDRAGVVLNGTGIQCIDIRESPAIVCVHADHCAWKALCWNERTLASHRRDAVWIKLCSDTYYMLAVPRTIGSTIEPDEL